MRGTIVAMAGLFLGCHVHVVDAHRPPPAHRADPVVVAEPPPPLSGTFRAREIKADVVRARVIYCKELHAESGGIRAIFDRRGHGGHGDEKGARGWGDDEVRAPEVAAEVIHAKEIRARHIEADEAHCKEVKIGRRHARAER